MAPPILRGAMVAAPWLGWRRGLAASLAAWLRRGTPAEPGEPWQRAAARRRATLLALVLLVGAAAFVSLQHTVPHGGHEVLRGLYVLLGTVLAAWVSAGFFTALMGGWVLWRGDPHALRLRETAQGPIDPQARTAIVMTICNEHVPTVFSGLRATCESLLATDCAPWFDVYVLSDSSDPALREAELAGVSALRQSLGSRMNVYYRLRRRRTQRKAGNIADFCRRWGRAYRYMVVLDADSVMSGECLVNLLRLMEAHPRAGIIQTLPQACGQDTLHARALQFAGRVSGRIFAAGMQYWQLGDSHYWGHNAILRVGPFMQHCALAPLRGRGGLAGDILSHDFMEAALMRRAGWQVWVAPNLRGSYEQVPSNLLEEVKRDRRWCQGNLQNARLLAEPGLTAPHRAMLVTGAMAYLSAPLWLAFIAVAALTGVLEDVPVAPSALPLAMWGAMLAMLMVPRVLGVASLLRGRERGRHGGAAALLGGATVEALLSTALAPVRMVAHSLFVLAAVTGMKLEWKSPSRESDAVPWGEATRRFAIPGIAAAALLGLLLHANAITALWLLPVALPLMAAVPLCVLSSRVAWGLAARRRRLLLIPEEVWMPAVLRRARRLTQRYLHRSPASPAVAAVPTARAA